MATLARLLFTLILLVTAVALLGAKPARTGQGPADGQDAAAVSAQPAAPPQIPLRRDLRFTIRPTLLGLVPPHDPLGFGECFVRVLSTDPLLVHYEIKEQHSAPLGTSRTQEVTTIRRGEITVSRAEPRLDPPILWQDGSWQAGGGLLWLRATEFAQLSETGLAPLDLRLLARPGDPVTTGLNRVAAERRALYGLTEDATQLIVQDWQAGYPAYVNGERTTLPAIRCTDSVRLAHYWILDDPDNPLLLKMSYIAPSLAESEPPVPVVKPAADSELRSDAEQVQEPPEPPQDPAAALIESGAGFAVVNIDF